MLHGGINQLQIKLKLKWRKHYNSAQSKRFSRLRNVVKLFEEIVTETNNKYTSEFILQTIDDQLITYQESMQRKKTITYPMILDYIKKIESRIMDKLSTLSSTNNIP